MPGSCHKVCAVCACVGVCVCVCACVRVCACVCITVPKAIYMKWSLNNMLPLFSFV